MTKEAFIEALKVIEARLTLYNCTFPYNLCHFDGTYMTADCWNLGKAIIWSQGECKDYWGVGQFAPVNPSTGMGDWDAVTIFDQCATYRSTDWADLINNGVGGEWIRMNNEHMGYHIGHGVVIESTPIWEDGVQYTYLGANGERISAPEYGSQYGGNWTEWCRIAQIEYGTQPSPKPQPTPPPQPTGSNAIYCVRDNATYVWLEDVVNDNDYAGIYGDAVSGFLLNSTDGNVHYMAHVLDYGWLPKVTNREDYAGSTYRGENIDALLIESDTPLLYRVHVLGGDWLPWVSTKDANPNDAEYGYAGIIGQLIDGVQVKPE